MAPRLARRGVAAIPRRGRLTLVWRRRRTLVLAAAVTAQPSTPGVHHLLQTFDLRRRYLVQVATPGMAAPGARLLVEGVRGQRPAVAGVAGATPGAVLAARRWRVPVPAPRLAARTTTAPALTLRSHAMVVHRLALAGRAWSAPGPRRTISGAPPAPFAAAPTVRPPRAAPMLAPAAAAIRAAGQRAVGTPMRAHRTLSTPSHGPRVPAPATFPQAAHPARLPLARPAAPVPASRPVAVTQLAPLPLAWARPPSAGAGAPAIAVARTPAQTTIHTTATPAQMAIGPGEHVVTSAREAARHEVSTALHSPANLERLAAEVMVRIDKRLRIERERRGL